MSRREGGATLLIALVLMALVTIGAAATLRFSVAGLRVAVNEELRSDAIQQAQSLIDTVLSAPANLTLALPIDGANCVSGVTDCNGDGTQDSYDQNTLSVATASTDSIFSREHSTGSILVRRLNPDASTPPRATGYSAVRFQASFLQVEASYDGTAGGWGQSTLTEGVAVIVPHYGR